MKSLVWKLKTKKMPYNLDDLEGILLKNRQIKDKKAFFNPKHPNKLTLKEVGLDPKEIKILAKRLKKTKEKKEKVVVFGDYDVDGITATAIMWQTLYAYGLDALPFIPERKKHGYGLSLKSLPDLLDLKPNLVITVDNGIVAHQAATALAEKGVDLVITDHHQLEINNSKLKIKNDKNNESGTQMRNTNESVRLRSSKSDREFVKQVSNEHMESDIKLPTALAVIHSTKLCGASVAWMTAREVAKALKININLDNLLDLAGMATIADQVPLTNANRSFAYFGLKQLRRTKNMGLKALLKQAGIKKLDQINETTVGFRLSPRINALGRLAHGMDALRLLCSTSLKKSSERAKSLSDTNLARQTLTQDAYNEARLQVKKNQLAENKIIIVSSTSFHEGVVGLIAGRLTEEFARPSLVISLSEDGMAKGSARSLPGIHITELLRQVKSELTEVGGHPMAAGFGLEAKNLKNFQKKITTLANETIDPSLLTTAKIAESSLPFEFVNLETVRLLDKFRPFGMGNPEPLFEIDNLKIVSFKIIGNGNKHLKLILKPANKPSSSAIEALWWGAGDKVSDLEIGQSVNILAKIEKNSWNGQEGVQLVIADLSF